MVPSIEETDVEAASAVIRSGMLVQGRQVADLEQKVSAQAGTRYAVAVSNGTASLHLALIALGIGPGDEVIVPAFSYIATANVVELVGARPVFVDIEPHTYNIDVSGIESKISGRTRVIMPVHEFGLCCDVSAVLALAESRGLHVVEDAACALGATENGRAAGGFGVMGSFSLHPRKSVTSGEGGVITTNDPVIARRLAVLRNHGIDSSGGGMDFVEPGYNYRLTDFQAALVNSQMERFEGILEHKRRLADVYLASLRSERLTLPQEPPGKLHTWQTFHSLLDASVDRAVLIARLKEAGIGTNYGAQCIPATTFYLSRYGHDCPREFPNAYAAYTRGLAIPIYGMMSEDDASYISDHINKSI
jgi:perosamine synthetase